jgi:hypothetical protein
MKGIFRRMSISNSFAVCIRGFQIATNEKGICEGAEFAFLLLIYFLLLIIVLLLKVSSSAAFLQSIHVKE